jgi:outer membrane protein assembly factor BamA
VTLTRFVRVQAGGTVFVPLPLRSVLASRVQGGVAHALSGSDELLPGKRFYEGGVNSHRGFHRRELGPLDADGNPLGGEVELLAGAELRLPIVWKLMGAAFCDVGQVWETRGEVNLGGLEPAAGGGLMLGTPVGPLSAYVGTRLRTPPAGQDRTVFHFTIGYAF